MRHNILAMAVVTAALAVSCATTTKRDTTRPEKDVSQDSIENFIADTLYFSNPALTVFLPHEPDGRIVLDFPGGGYGGIAGNHEGSDWALFFNKIGVAYAVLRYKLPAGNPNTTMNDVMAAMDIIISHSTEWGVDSGMIGVMGFSAGGHIAAYSAACFSGQYKPAFQILFYPVVTMHSGDTHEGSRANLLGPDASRSLEDAYSVEMHIDASTPRAYLTLADKDNIVPPSTNGFALRDSMVCAGVDVTFIVYDDSTHGWSSSYKYMADVKSNLEYWLRLF